MSDTEIEGANDTTTTTTTRTNTTTPTTKPTRSVATERVLEARKDFENALAKIKGQKGTTRLNIDPQEMEEACNELCKQMQQAAEKDQQSIRNGKAGLEKQKMLKEVLSFLDREPMHEIMLDCGILQPLRVWMEPLLASKTLPNTSFRLAILEKLRTLPIDSDYLRESGGLGRLVMFFACRQEEDPKIQRISKELISVWSRPIIAMCNPSATATDDRTNEEERNDEDGRRRTPQVLRSKALLNRQDMMMMSSPQSAKKSKYN